MATTLYRVMTVDSDHVITAVLDSDRPITPELLADTPYAGQTTHIIQEEAEYSVGNKLEEYTPEGILRPLIDRVLDGLCPVPDGYELVDGELVPRNPTPEDTPKRLQETIDSLRAQIVDLQKAALGV